MVFENCYANKLYIYGEGTQIRPFIHIDNCIEILSSFQNSQLKPGTYNLVEGHYSILDIVGILNELNKDLEYTYVARNTPMKSILVKSSDEINNMIEKSSLRERLKELINKVY